MKSKFTFRQEYSPTFIEEMSHVRREKNLHIKTVTGILDNEIGDKFFLVLRLAIFPFFSSARLTSRRDIDRLRKMYVSE